MILRLGVVDDPQKNALKPFVPLQIGLVSQPFESVLKEVFRAV